MTEEEKLDAGLYYDFWDAGVNGRKLGAIKFCRELRKHYNVTILPGVTIGNNVDGRSRCGSNKRCTG